MIYRWNNLAKLSALGALCSLIVSITSTSAKDGETSVLVKKQVATTPQSPPDQGPVLPPPARQSAPSSDPFAPQKPSTPNFVSPLPPAATPTLPRPSSTVKRPFMQPAQPREPARGQLSAQQIQQVEPMPAPAGQPTVDPPMLSGPPVQSPNVRPTPPIEYDTDHDARKMYRTGQIQLVLVTQDPADGCLYEIPLCIPACCTGEPRIKGGKGLLGRGLVEYCWACGFKAKVKFRHIRGDVKVEYEGD